MAKRSGSRTAANEQIDEVVAKLKRDAAPAVARALNLDSAEAVEAALNAGVELVLAARAVVRALPLPPDARAHLDRAEGEALRAARMAVRGIDRSSLKKRAAGATQVKVDFKKDRSAKRRGGGRRP